MKTVLGLGEYGNVFYYDDRGRVVAAVYYRDVTGHRLRIRAAGKSKAEARRRLEVKVAKRPEVVPTGERPKSMTLGEAAVGWLESIELRVSRGNRSPSTLELYRRTVVNHIEPKLGGLKPAEVTTSRMDRFLQDVLESSGYATAKLCRTALSGICSWLVRHDLMHANPIREVTPLEQNRDRTAKALTTGEIEQWLAIVDADATARRKDLPDLARFLLATGARLGEALGVHWTDVNFEEGTVRIDRTIIRVKGRGLIASRLKSRASYRTLVLPQWCLAMLWERPGADGGGEVPIFADTRGGYRDRSNVGRAFREVRKDTDFDWVKTHTYRKTVATILDGGGASARLIADQLGHARISMTQDVYMGRRAVDTGAARLLDGLVEPARSQSEPITEN